MSNKLVLVVDKEKFVLDAIQKELQGIDESCRIITTSDGFSALELLQESPIEVVITDYDINDINGLELLEAIRSLQPKTRVILIADNHHDHIEEQAHRLQVNHFLTKPFELEHFKKIYREVLNLDRMTVRKPGISVISEERYEQITAILRKMNHDIGARCILLSDTGGHIMARIGNQDGMDTDIVVPLLGGGIATLTEVGRQFDGDSEAINLLYHEGERECIYGIYLGQQTMIVITMSKASSKLGLVWFYAQQIAEELRDLLSRTNEAAPSILMDQNINDAFDNELDQLFENSSLTHDEVPSQTTQPDLFKAPVVEPPAKNEIEVELEVKELNDQNDDEVDNLLPDLTAVSDSNGDLIEGEKFSFQQAVAQGLISGDLAESLGDQDEPQQSEEELVSPDLIKKLINGI